MLQSNRSRNGSSDPCRRSIPSTRPGRPRCSGTFTAATAVDVDRAVAAASDAQREWARRPIPARADLIARAADVIAERKGQLAELVAREAGKVLVEAGGDVQEAVDMGRFVAGQGRAALGEVVASELSNKMAWTTRQPIGVVGMITPWNFPVAIPSWKCFPALLAGNGIVLKPSEHTPLCADAFVDALVAAGDTGGTAPGRPRGGRARCCTRSAPRRRRALVHRLGADRQARRRARAMESRSPCGVARARRQERDGRPRRRRPRPRRRRRAVRRVRHVGSALHFDVAPRGASRSRDRGRRGCREAGRGARARRSDGCHDRCRARDRSTRRPTASSG